MAPVLPNSPSSLELTISMPAYTSSPSGEERGGIIMKGLDMNRLPAGTGGGLGAEEEYWGMAISVEDEEESGGNNNFINNNTTNCVGPPRKKLRLSKEQSRLLEESFRHNHTLNPKQKEALALQLKLKPRQVEVWFQNRRARSKLKQTEMECEYLKRWFGSLTEQNRRLQREVEELRAMKVGPPTVISPGGRGSLPASTLSMCPRCERVTTTTPTSTPVASDRDGHARVVKPIASHHRPSPAAC